MTIFYIIYLAYNWKALSLLSASATLLVSWGSLIAMVREYKVTFEKLSIAKLRFIFCWALPPNLCQFWVSVTLKPFRISQNCPHKYFIWVENYWSTKFWAEQNSCEYIIVTQIWYKCVIGSWPPKNGKIAQNSMRYKIQITYDRKLKFSGFISVTERFISAKFY